MTNIITLPGLIDPHVHLRTPGQEYKEDFTTGTAAAIAGGFTTILDMPNNLEPIIDLEKLQEKRELAKQKILCDVGFYFGTDGNNIEEFEKVKQYVKGLKVFLNHTTGNLLIENKETIEKVIEAWTASLPILFHAEGEKILTVIELAVKYQKRVHICHLSSAEELAMVITAKEKGVAITCGVTPHHLFLNNLVREKRGGIAMMKPGLKTQQDIDFLWEHLDAIDMIESDHAPHALEEKQTDKPPFGVPGLETTLPLLLTAMHEHKLTIDIIKQLCFETPSKIFGIKQAAETKIEVDLDKEWIVENDKLQTKCKWSPFNGWNMKGRIERIFIRGTKVFESGKILVDPGFGKVI